MTRFLRFIKLNAKILAMGVVAILFLCASIFCLSFTTVKEDTSVNVYAETTPSGNWSDNAASRFAGGLGTESAPYQIATAEQLAYLSKSVNYSGTSSVLYVKLTRDIDLSAHYWTPIGKTNNYKIVFNGNNHVVYGLKINDSSAAGKYAGLFGLVSDLTIQNVILKNTDINLTSECAVGLLCGFYNNSNRCLKIENCLAIGNISYTNTNESGSYGIGGVVGSVIDSSIESYIKNTTVKCIITTGRSKCVGSVVGYCAYEGGNPKIEIDDIIIDSTVKGYTIKKYVGDFGGTATSDWFFGEKINGGVPCLKSMYWIGGHYSETGSEIVSQLNKKGFSKETNIVPVVTFRKINLSVNKDVGTITATPDSEVIAGETITLEYLINTGKENYYEFDKYTSSDVTITNPTFTMPDKDVTIKGNFKYKTYTIIYIDSFSGQTISAGSYTYNPDTTQSITYSSPADKVKTISGTEYVFDTWSIEWTDSINSTTLPEIDNISETLKSPAGCYGNITLTAVWRKNQAFFANNWKEKMSTQLGVNEATFKSKVKSILFTKDKSEVSKLTNPTKISVGATSVGDVYVNQTQWDANAECSNVTAYVTGNATDGYNIVFYSHGTIYAPRKSSELFEMCDQSTSPGSAKSAVESIVFDNFDTSKTVYMRSLFELCNKLKSISFGSNFNTTNVTDMSGMFRYCSKLTRLDLSNFDTSNVTSMSSMFGDCSDLTSLDLSKFNNVNVTSMQGCFDHCSSLTNIIFGENFITTNLYNMGYIFRYCSSLTSLDLRSFKTSNVQYMQGIFFGCSNLTGKFGYGDDCVIKISPNFTTSKVTDMSYMFYNCSKLKNLDLRGFDTESVNNISFMFSDCRGLTGKFGYEDDCVIKISSNFKTSSVTRMSSVFRFCVGLTSLDLSEFNTEKVVNMGEMFGGCYNLNGTFGKNGTAIKISDNFKTSSVEKMSSMFDQCFQLTNLDLSGFNTAKVTDMRIMFRGCSGLTSLDLSEFDTSNVTDISYMFNSCSGLTTLNLSNFDTSKVTDMSEMFYNCKGLAGTFGTEGTAIKISSNFTTSNVTSMSNMFYGCEKLASLNLSNFNTSSVKKMSNMFYGCSKLTGTFGTEGTAIKISSNFTTSNVTKMSSMFSGCSGLTSLDLSGFDLSSCTSVASLLNNCSGLTTLKTPTTSGSLTISLPDKKANGAAKYWYMHGETTPITSISIGSKSYTLKTTRDWDYDEAYLLKNWANEINNSLTTGLSVDNFKLKIKTIAFTKTKPNSGTEISVGATSVGDVYGNQPQWDANAECSNVTACVTGNATDGYNIVFYSPATIYAPKTCAQLFKGMTGLESITFNNFDTSNVTDMSSMFYNCSKLTSLNLSNFNTSNVTDMSWMFYNCSKLTSLDLSGFNTEKVGTKWNSSKNSYEGDMSWMFCNCSKLTSLNLSNFNTSNVTDMSYMFSGCSELTSLNLSSFNTEKVVEMYSMFYGCSKLENINFGSNFTTSQVKSMSYMFSGCKGLKSLDLSNFNTSRVTGEWGMSYMFSNCSVLENINFGSNFTTSNVTNMSQMFYKCSGLTELDLSKFDLSKCTSASELLYNCSGLTVLKTPTTSGSLTISLPGNEANGAAKYWFKREETTPITSITIDSTSYTLTTTPTSDYENAYLLKRWKGKISVISSVKSILFTRDFEEVKKLENPESYSVGATSEGDEDGSQTKWTKGVKCCYVTAYVTGDDTNGYNIVFYSPATIYAPKNSYQLFYNMVSLESIKFDNFDTSKVTDMSEMFFWCFALKSITFGENFKTSSVENMSSMFCSSNKLTSLDLSGFDTSKVTDMSYMFSGCSELTSITFGNNFDTSSVTNMSSMFFSCSSLTSLDLSKFDLSKCTEVSGMFFTCRKLTTLETPIAPGMGDEKSLTIDLKKTMYKARSSEGIRTIKIDKDSKSYTLKTTRDWDYDEAYLLKNWANEINNSLTTGLSVDNFKLKIKTIAFTKTKPNSGTEISVGATSVGDVKGNQGWNNDAECCDVTAYVIGNATDGYNIVFYSPATIYAPKYCSELFASLSELNSIKFDNFDTSKVIDMAFMFYGCSGLTSLDLSNFILEKSTHVNHILINCNALTILKTPKVKDASNVIYMDVPTSNGQNWYKKGDPTEISCFTIETESCELRTYYQW